jgi:hypothetical protein
VLPIKGSDMSQISLPVRILLAGAILLLAAWFTVLKPSDDATTAAVPAPVPTTVPAKDPNATASSAAGKVVQKAVAAKETAEQAGAAAAGETTSAAAGAAAKATAAAPKAAAAAKAAVKADPKTKGLPLRVAKAVADHKVLVLLFWNPKAADDRLVHRAVAGIGRHKGKVVVQSANVAHIARYAPITRGVDVQQSPSVVVVDRDLQGELLVGFVDRQSIEQAVGDALKR